MLKSCSCIFCKFCKLKKSYKSYRIFVIYKIYKIYKILYDPLYAKNREMMKSLKTMKSHYKYFKMTSFHTNLINKLKNHIYTLILKSSIISNRFITFLSRFSYLIFRQVNFWFNGNMFYDKKYGGK
jgi:hypothetical protein